MRPMGPLATSVYRQKYSMNGEETWDQTAHRVATNVMAALGYAADSEEVVAIEELIRDRKFLPGGRYLYASGRPLHQTQNCLLLRAEDTREGWAELWWKAGMALMTGAGIGVDYSDIRPAGTHLVRTGGIASGPVSLMQAVNEVGRQVMQGGSRRSAIWAGLNWAHPDVFEFIRVKDWKGRARQAKAEDHEFPLPMELTNISVILDDEFFVAYEDAEHPKHQLAHDVYDAANKRMLKTAEPGFSIDTGANAGETLRNACTEVTSADDSDICNLGSINLARVESKGEMLKVVKLATLFLLAGTVYSHVPYAQVDETRTKNRRLGLGVMGVHEWLLRRGKPYAPDPELGRWLAIYARSTEYAQLYAREHELSEPVKTRAIAPTGTIGIIAETTTGIEPVFCVAYKRRWSQGDSFVTDNVVDPTAKRLVDEFGIDPETIEDAYSIPVERRLAFQAWMQTFVDHGISSTINLPAPITDPTGRREFAETLYQFLPQLRGVTVYPDGARAGQPITPMSWTEAVNPIVTETEERCVGGACSI